jgi:hypothetical protein
MVRKKFQNYTCGAVGDGDRDLPQCTTAVGRCYLPLWGTAVGVQSFFQKFIIFCLNSYGDKLYMKIVKFNEIYNFVVQSFSI